MEHYDWISNCRVMEPLPTGMVPAGRVRGIIQAVLFDVYGTLFISGSGDIGVTRGQTHAPAELESLRRHYQISWTSGQILQKLVDAIRDYHKQEKSKGVDFPEVNIDRIWQKILKWQDMVRIRRFAEAYETIVNPTFPMPGLDQVLRALRRRSILMGIISNAQFFTPHLFKTFLGASPAGLGFARDLTLYSYEYRRAKPSAFLFEQAAIRLQHRGVQPESVLYVGNDMRNDIQPAKAVGFQTALYAGDRRSLRQRDDDPALQSTSPDMVLTDLRQLLEFEMAAFASSD